MLLISKMRSLLTTKYEKQLRYDVLDSILNSYESFNAYRAQYKSSLKIENVVEFLTLNPKYPKSLIFILSSLLDSLKQLPNHTSGIYLDNIEELIFKAYSMLKLTNAKRLLSSQDEDFIYPRFDETLSLISDLLASSSEELTKTYFSHYNE